MLGKQQERKLLQFSFEMSLKNFRAISFPGDENFYGEFHVAKKQIKLTHEIVCFSIIEFYLHAVSIYDVSFSTYYRLHIS